MLSTSYPHLHSRAERGRRATQLNPSALSASPRLCVRYLEAARRRFPQSNGLSNPFYTFYMFYGHSQLSHEIK